MKRFFIIVAIPALAHGEEWRCPDRYPSTGMTLPAPAAWTGRLEGNALLTTGGVLVGPPDVNGELRGEERKVKDGYQTSYRGLNDYRELQPKWFFCGYGLGGEIRLLHRLPDNTEACFVKYKHNPAPNAPTITGTCSSPHADAER